MATEANVLAQTGSKELDKDTEKQVAASNHPQTIQPDSKPSETDNTVKKYSTFRWILICLSVYISIFLYGLDNTIVASVQAPILQSFGNVNKLSWLGVGFPLGSIASILGIGKAFGVFDVKWVYIGSFIHFIAGSALCGAAPNMIAMIFGRVWAGLGGAGVYLGVLNIMSINTPPKTRPMYLAGCPSIWGLGCILGPVIGGSFADSSATWRWAFYINLLLFAAFIPVILFMLEPFNPDPERSFTAKMKSMDWVGITLNAAMYTTFVIAVTFGGALWAWSDGRTIATFVVFGFLVTLFAIQQTFSIFTTPTNRIFPIDFLKNRDLVVQYIAISAAATSLFIYIYYIPIYFAFTKGDKALDAAVRLLPFMSIVIVFFMINGMLLPKVGYYAPFFLAGGIFSILTSALFYVYIVKQPSTSLIYGLSALAALGIGLPGQSSYSVAQVKVPESRVADAVGFINQAQMGGIGLALTITGAVFQNVGYNKIAAIVQGLNYTSADIHVALSGAKSTIIENASPEVKARVIAAIIEAIQQGFVLVLAAGGVSIITALLMKWERLGLGMSTGG